MNVTSLTLIVCTYKRPEFFKTCMAAVGALEIPDGFDFQLAVSDNNPVTHHDDYIGAVLAGLPFPTHYGHATTRGYSSARNTGLELALGTQAQVFAFLDDDLLLDPQWLLGQIRTYREFDCDGVAGPILGSTKPERFQHGKPVDTWGMANTSFQRDWADKNGLDLEFDLKCNLTGYEDRAFTQAATSAGKVLMRSEYPVVIDPSAQENSLEERINKSELAVIAARNKIVRLREDGKWLFVIASVIGSLHYGVKAGGLGLQILYERLAGLSDKARLHRIERAKEFGKMTASFAGLRGSYIARQDARRGG